MTDHLFNYTWKFCPWILLLEKFGLAKISTHLLPNFFGVKYHRTTGLPIKIHIVDFHEEEKFVMTSIPTTLRHRSPTPEELNSGRVPEINKNLAIIPKIFL